VRVGVPKEMLEGERRVGLVPEGVEKLRDRGIEVVTLQPTAADLEQMSGDSMDPTRAEAVCRQVGESTIEHVRDTEIADRLTALGS